jgi:serine/threonine protein phosphatase 1
LQQVAPLATIKITPLKFWFWRSDLMPSRVIAIGDVHGCAAGLRAVVGAVGPTSDDVVVVLGDCVDRGPDSRGVIDELLQLREKCELVPLLGNHEEMMLNVIDGKPQPDDWLQVGGAATVASYRDGNGKVQAIPDEHVDFIRSWGDYYETVSHFFAHASYEPEQALASQHWQTMRWQSLKFGIPAPHVSGKTAIVGHTSQKSGEVLYLGHLTCIDTFCWGGGWLTALDVMTGEVWQADRTGALRASRLAARPEKSP